jgi:hypothetical protein
VEKNTSKAYVESTGPIGGALAPAGEAGSSLFLINLCASMAPAQLASKALAGLESYRLYQVTRVEDGRTRYRLRLGFFATQAEAEAVLVKVRDQYPTSFTACLCEEDRRHTRGYVVNTAPAKPAMSVVPSAPKPSTPTAAPAAAKPVTPAAKSSTPVAAPAAKTPHVSKPVAKAATTTSPIQVKPQAAAPKAAPAPQISARSSSASFDNILDLDNLSWDPPALNSQPAANKASTTGKHETVAAVFKTQPVLKAEPPKAKAPSSPAAKIEPKVDAGASMRARALELTLSDPPAPAPAQKARAAPNEPFHVGKGVDIPTMQLSLQSEPASASKAATQLAAKNTGKSALPAPVTASAKSNRSPTPTAKSVATPAAAKPAPSAPSVAKHPDLDSTQTIRALTSEELNDDAQEKCFAIQLAASEQPVNLDTMPHLDIFEAYRLYSVAIAGSGKIVHSLRLGFFKEAVSAEAVAGYLKTFFSSPSVLRISVAEQTRFKDAVPPKKPAPMADSKAQANVIELDSARASRVPTVTMEVVPTTKSDTSATGSFKVNSTGSFRTGDTATHRALAAAAKSATPPTKRSAPISNKKTASSKTSSTGKYKIPPKKSLAQALLEEAKEVELSESGIHKLPKNDSLLSRLVDKLKK